MLGVAQLVAWGILYYAFGVLAPAMQADLGLSSSTVYGAFSWCVLVAGLAATPVGMAIDRLGGRWIMAAGSLCGATGVAMLSQSTGFVTYFLAWTLIGLGMAMSLYEAAFATLNRNVAEARQAISNVTLFGGLASTAFWPLTDILLRNMGWRGTYALYALLIAVICCPMHLLLESGSSANAKREPHLHTDSDSLSQAIVQPVFWLLASAFAANAFIFSALSVHLIPLLRSLLNPGAPAVLLVASIGPMQVLGRVLERTLGSKTAPQVIGIYTFAALPAALGVLTFWGHQAWAAAVFCCLYGLSNGVITILRGTLPQALFGRTHYGAISGAMAAPALIAKAAGPVVLAVSGYDTLLWTVSGLSIGSFLIYLLTISRRVSSITTSSVS